MKKPAFSTYTILVILLILFGLSVPIIRTYQAKLAEKKKLKELDTRIQNQITPLYEVAQDNIIIFYSPYNNTSLLAINYFDNLSEFAVPVIKRVEGEPNFYSDLRDLKNLYGKSYGSSDSFEFYPIIFYKDKSYSGFNNKVERMVLRELGVKEENLPAEEIPCYIKRTSNLDEPSEEVPCSMIDEASDSAEVVSY